MRFFVCAALFSLFVTSCPLNGTNLTNASTPLFLAPPPTTSGSGSSSSSGSNSSTSTSGTSTSGSSSGSSSGSGSSTKYHRRRVDARYMAM